jgi:hypothetical protein
MKMRSAALALCMIAFAAPVHAKVKKPVDPSTPQLTAAEPVPFDSNEATRQIRARMGVVRACYERASRNEPGLEGKLQLGFDISEVGQVSSTSVEVDGIRTLLNPWIARELASCIRTQAIGWRLAPEGPVGGAHVSYVFVFAASN